VPLGLLAVADVAPLALSDDLLSMLSVFGARAGVELERIRAEAQVSRLNADLERRVATGRPSSRRPTRARVVQLLGVARSARALRHIGGFVELLQRDAGPALPARPRPPRGDCRRRLAHGHAHRRFAEFSRVGRAGLHLVNVELAVWC